MDQARAEPAHTVRWAVTDAVLVLFGAQLASLVWVGIVAAVAYDGDVPDPVPIGTLVLLNLGLWAGYGLGPLLVARIKGDGVVSDYGARIEAFDVPLGLVLGVFTQLVLLPLLYFPIERIVDDDPSQSARDLIDRIDGPGEAILFTLSVAVMAPLVEELFFRGLLLRALQRRLGSWPAIAISAAVFAIVHQDLLLVPGLFLFGALAGWLTVRTGRLGPAWAAHVGFNLATLVVIGLL